MEKFTGEYIEETKEGRVYINFVDGVKNGITKFTDTSGTVLSEIEYKNDIIDGKIKQYYPTGNLLSSTSYVNGVPNGDFLTFYENGMKQVEATYLDGKFEGLFITYDEFGDKISECSYKNGLKHGKNIVYYSKANGGGISEISYYENGLLEKDKTELYPTGEILSITPYIHGKAQKYPELFKKDGTIMKKS